MCWVWFRGASKRTHDQDLRERGESHTIDIDVVLPKAAPTGDSRDLVSYPA